MKKETANLIRGLNRISPFTWELEIEGNSFTILCEESEVRDPETGTMLSNLSEASCQEWLARIIRMEEGEE